MNNSITNTVDIDGLFDNTPTGLSEAVVTAMTDELSLTKVANKQMWASGNLTYTITVTNNSTTLEYENVTFSDTIDPTLAALVENTVKLNGTDVIYQYNTVTGELILNIGDIPAPGNAIVTFDVSKV